jgi:hypothetical protein
VMVSYFVSDTHMVMITHSCHVCFGFAGSDEMVSFFEFLSWIFLCNLLGVFSSILNRLFP